MVTTCNRNEQQQDAKNNAELWTEWRNTTWKTFEESIKRGRNMSIKASVRTADDGDYDSSVI